MSAVSEPPVSKAPSVAVLAAVVAVLTLVAAAGGWFLGGELGLVPPASKERPVAGEPAAEAAPAGNVVVLKPILTNVKVPQDVWIRLEAGLVIAPDAQVPDELSTAVAADFMAFLRTVNLMQLRGPAGLEYLRMDLKERARMRTDGVVTNVYIWALVME
ncbi:flagellar basal body-associated FliL family protein [Phyllobacterium sp. 0TCS1.6C]|uniref:flagellar basal body-associated FliL family protein n=1 Tax=unclassified Phyllobacterium TaxID=2638441 RepID=UPI002263DFF2|nr:MULTISPECIES: flagellar basal body-associated FliL family protein [unclassified Phyllobacterium]MCX8280933.1 flagellar basal body-associated FliL family protein [Phyllobacterium sp. 0TCS1.6C]MCX8295799.1 flagellar basal body-associated FliL family protein [Phyllobacterium sp. 0TCS1.6A]